MKNNKFEFYMKKAAIGVICAVIFLIGLFAYSKDIIFGEIFLYEVMPKYTIKTDASTLFKLTDNESTPVNKNMENEQEILKNENENKQKIITSNNDLKDINNNIIKSTDTGIELIGVDDIIFQSEVDSTNIENHFQTQKLTSQDINKLKDLDFLKQNFYIVDKKTAMTKDYFDVEKFMSADLKIDTSSNEPKVLIFHTHSKEMFKDSNPNNLNEGIVGAGNKLAETLENKYNIKTIHHVKSYDVVDGKTQILGAYERMEPDIRKILKDNPSIEVVIDLHRDGVADNVHLVKNINGKPTAQFMFFNGICRLNSNGKLQEISNLKNPYIDTNLALSFNMQLNANSLYPGITRKVYLNAYRYSLHMMPKSMLVELGAQTNTKEEAFNAAEILADVIASVII